MKFKLREILRRSQCLPAFILLWLTLETPANGEELTTAAAVRGLTVEQAQQPMRVHLRGVVTFFDENLYKRFIQDHTAGIYLQASTNTPPLVPGQVVDEADRPDWMVNVTNDAWFGTSAGPHSLKARNQPNNHTERSSLKRGG